MKSSEALSDSNTKAPMAPKREARVRPAAKAKRTVPQPGVPFVCSLLMTDITYHLAGAAAWATRFDRGSTFNVWAATCIYPID